MISSSLRHCGVAISRVIRVILEYVSAGNQLEAGEGVHIWRECNVNLVLYFISFVDFYVARGDECERESDGAAQTAPHHDRAVLPRQAVADS